MSRRDDHGVMARQGLPKTIVIVVFDGFTLLDMAGPCDVFRAASLLGAQPGYRLVIASPDGRPALSNSGVEIGVDAPVDLVSRRSGIDTMLVVGGAGVGRVAADPRALAGLRRLSARSRRTTSVCTGALALAAAGLLDGHRATTHWSACGRLATERPEVSVQPDQIYVHDRDRWTSAGVTAGIDLSLALVEEDYGSELAHAAAGWLVVFVRRPGGQSQFSVQMQSQPARTPAIVELQRWLPDNLGEDLSVEILAERCGMSPRHFARVFRSEVGATPASLVESLRVEAAKRLLESSDLVVGTIAARVGFRRGETLHRAFQRRVGTTPNSYRQHFQRRAS